MTDAPSLVLDAIGRQRVVPVLRTASAAELRRAADRCLAAGYTVLELTATTPDWTDALQRLREDRPDAVLGLGTALTAEQARTAVDLGADFVVSPIAAPHFAEIAERAVAIPGALTPTEMADAATRAPLVKLFPAASVGVAHLRAVRDVLPDLRVMPTGGIAPAEVASWLEAGAYAVGLGSALLRLSDGDLASVRRAVAA